MASNWLVAGYVIGKYIDCEVLTHAEVWISWNMADGNFHSLSNTTDSPHAQTKMPAVRAVQGDWKSLPRLAVRNHRGSGTWNEKPRDMMKQRNIDAQITSGGCWKI